jgi:acyl-CoA thioesterase FadM/DNA-binding MarR family transcriptional regulator
MSPAGPSTASQPAVDDQDAPPRGALERALGLIELLAAELPHASLSDLARASGLSMSTTSRLLGTLVQAQLVERDESRRYVLGRRLVELGRRATQAQAVSSLQDVRPVRDDAVAVLSRELSEARQDLLTTLAGLGEERHVEQARWLTDAVAAEQAWLDCAKIITDSPGATVGLPPEPVVSQPGGSARVAALADVTGQAESVRRLNMGLVERLDDEALSRVGTHRSLGPVSVLQCLQEVARSDRDLQAAVSGKSIAHRDVRPRAASASITHERRVLLHHVNLRGIVTTVATLIYLEEAEAELLRSLGLLDLAHRFSRIYFEIQHRRPSFYDDVVTVHLMVNRVGDTSVHYDFTVFNQGRVAAFGTWGLCLMDEGGQPTAIPPEPRRALVEARPIAPTGQEGTT